jgi:hypothetical protein
MLETKTPKDRRVGGRGAGGPFICILSICTAHVRIKAASHLYSGQCIEVKLHGGWVRAVAHKLLGGAQEIRGKRPMNTSACGIRGRGFCGKIAYAGKIQQMLATSLIC